MSEITYCKTNHQRTTTRLTSEFFVTLPSSSSIIQQQDGSIHFNTQNELIDVTLSVLQQCIF